MQNISHVQSATALLHYFLYADMATFHSDVFRTLMNASLFYYSQKDLVSAFQYLYAYAIYLSVDFAYDESKSIEENYFTLLNMVMSKLRDIMSSTKEVAISSEDDVNL